MCSDKFFNSRFLGKNTTEKLVKLFNWDGDIVRIMKQECRAKNERLVNRRLMENFFKFPDTVDQALNAATSNKNQAITYGRYYKLMVEQHTSANLPPEFWNGKVTTEEVSLAKTIFNRQDSEMAIIVSELADLHLSSLGSAQVPRYSESHFSNPVSHFSELECFRRAEQNIEDDPALKAKLLEMENKLQNTSSWTDHQLSSQFRLPNVALFRFNTGACLGYDWQAQQFCKEPAVADTHKCVKHADNVDLKLIREIGSLTTKRGISIAKVKNITVLTVINYELNLGCCEITIRARKAGRVCRICSMCGRSSTCFQA